MDVPHLPQKHILLFLIHLNQMTEAADKKIRGVAQLDRNEAL